MESSSNAEYSNQFYWDKRYTDEKHYDWFASVYDACVTAMFDAIEDVYRHQSQHPTYDGVLKVLHLGTGNSSLCADLRAAYERRYPDGATRPYRLIQIATDYSLVVIQHMKELHAQDSASEVACPLTDVFWEVADVRDLATIRTQHGPFFDVVIDKGTMDALQTGENHADVEKNINSMLLEVSRSIGGLMDRKPYRLFLQVTWEIPYKRLHYTTRNPSFTFAWGSSVEYQYLDDSDIYRIYRYLVSGGAEKEA